MEYKIGDKVRVVPYEELPARCKNKGVAHVCYKEGVVVDKLYSDREMRTVYKVHLDAFANPSTINFTDDMLELVGGGRGIELKISVEVDGVAVEMYKGGERLKRSFGRLMYDGEYGVAQAAAWACKLLMRSFEETEG